MTKGSCIIDGIDIADYGVFILKGGDFDFLSYPQRIEPPQNNWHEMDGIDVNLDNIYFTEKKIMVKFYIAADTANEFNYNFNQFFNLLSSPGYRKLKIREFDRTFDLRYIACNDYSHDGGLNKNSRKRGELNVEFSMDDPLQIFTNKNLLYPISYRNNRSYVTINGFDLSRFGIIVNECYNTILNPPKVKSPLIRKFEKANGLNVSCLKKERLENKQITIACTMLGSSIEEFYTNYEALFNQLTKSSAITLSTLYTDSECYFSAMNNFVKLEPFSSRVKISFDLVLTVIKPNRPPQVLATESGLVIATEDGTCILIA